MNKFQRVLGFASKEIRKARAFMINEDMTLEQQRLIDNISEARRGINRKLLEITDVNRDSELSLMVTKKDFNAKDWVEKKQTLELELVENEIELLTAQKTYDEWFADDGEEPFDITTDDGKVDSKPSK